MYSSALGGEWKRSLCRMQVSLIYIQFQLTDISLQRLDLFIRNNIIHADI